MSRTLLAILVAVVLAACGQLPRPFQPEYKGEDNPLLLMRDRAGVSVRPIEGLPAGASAALAGALSESLRNEGVIATAGPGNASSLVLNGIAWQDATGWLVTLVLSDPNGTRLTGVFAHVAAGAADNQKSWSGYANAMAKSVVAALQPQGTIAAATAKSRVAIGDITGAPGDGGRALARSLAYTLKRTQFDLVDSVEDATHIVVGMVEITPRVGRDGTELRHVGVRWAVLRPDRSEIGQVQQANDVPARYVERNWAELALAVADAAADGIAELVIRTPAAPR